MSNCSENIDSGNSLLSRFLKRARVTSDIGHSLIGASHISGAENGDEEDEIDDEILSDNEKTHFRNSLNTPAPVLGVDKSSSGNYGGSQDIRGSARTDFQPQGMVFPQVPENAVCRLDEAQNFNRVEDDHLEIPMLSEPQITERYLFGDLDPIVEPEDQQDISTFDKEVILCLNFNTNKLGAISYRHKDSSLSILEDFNFWIAGEGMSVLRDKIIDTLASIILEINPDIILTTSGLYEFVSIFNDSREAKITVEVRPSKEFNSKNNNRTVHNLIEGILNGQRGQFHIDSALVSLQNSPDLNLSRGALSCLVRFFENYNNFDFTIKAVDSINLHNHLFIDQESLYALQVLPDPKNFHVGNTKSGKGKTSIFDLLNFTGSKLGGKLLNSWVSRPLYDLEKIQKRQNSIEFFMNSEAQDFFNDLRKVMKCLPNIFQLVTSLNGSKFTLQNWKNLDTFLKKTTILYVTIDSLYNRMLNAGNQIDIIENIHDKCDINKVRRSLTRLNMIIDFDSSKIEYKTIIHEGIERKLDEYRTIYNSMDGILNQTADDVAKTFPQYLQRFINAAYIPQVGYLMLLNIFDINGEELELSNIIQELTTNRNWSMIFNTSTTIFFKNEKVIQMDEEYGDIYSIICDLEIEILYNLQQEILEIESTLLNFGKYFAELDCLLSLTHVAISRNYCKPILTNGIELEIVESRHPLYETLLDESSCYVPNKVFLNTTTSNPEKWQLDSERIILLTGANFSGKSVYITQVALLVILAQIGSFIPAKSATIGLVDKVLTRVMSRESLSKTQSTFMIDSQQMSKCLRLMTRKSLIVIDEFGKGTDVYDGPALFGSIIEYLRSHSKCPRVIAATHFKELYDGTSQIFEELDGLHHYHMDVYFSVEINEARENLDKKITFLYEINDGIADKSFGIYCAKMCGIKPSIISFAEKYLQKLEQGGNLKNIFAKLSPQEENDLKSAHAISKSVLKLDVDDLKGLPREALREKLNEILQNNSSIDLSSINSIGT